MADQIVQGGGRGGYSQRRSPLPISALQQYNPNRPDATEAIWQPFYHFQSYALAGQSNLTFFQTPKGQLANGYADTNMENAGSFPAPTAFLCTAIMVVYMPAGNPSTTGTQGVVNPYWNDSVLVANSGYLELTIGSKVYMRDAPVGKFPPNFTVNGFGFTMGNATAANIAQTGYARAAGRYAEITPFLIPQSQNFNVSLYWPTVQAVSATGRIGVILDGFYYRQSQ
jgi:hypothetical protein